MKCFSRILSSLLPAVALVVSAVGIAEARVAPASACSRLSVCDRALGVELIAPSSWSRLDRVPRSEIDFATPGRGQEGYMRLVIRVYSRFYGVAPLRAATLAASELESEYREPNVHVTRHHVVYGGSMGMLLHGLAPTPQAASDILIARNHVVYLVIAPGSHLQRDQRQALSTLRFIHRTGSLAFQSNLSVQPNPAVLRKPLRISLTGARPWHNYSFTAFPQHRSGFGGGNMGTRRANAIGTVHFTYSAFARSWEVGNWVIRVYSHRRETVALVRVLVHR